MAWISVHEQVTGMKLRELSKCIGCSQKEALGILVSLWLWGINNATKDGELRGSDKSDIQDALSIGLSAGLSTEKIVDCLIDNHWIDREGGVYILHDWDLWQEQWYKALDRRAYDANRKREERKKKESECPPENPQDNPPENPVQPSPLPLPSPIPEGKKNSGASPQKSFKPPTLEEVQAYCNERNNDVDAQKWIDFYMSKAWMIGKNKMKDWKAAVRTWEKGGSNGTHKQPDGTDKKTFKLPDSFYA